MASEVSTVPGFGTGQQYPVPNPHSLEISFGGNGSSSPNSNSSSSNGPSSSSSGKDEVGKSIFVQFFCGDFTFFEYFEFLDILVLGEILHFV